MVTAGIRRAVERLYTGRCDIIDQQEMFDLESGQTSFAEVVVASGQRCRLSYSYLTAAEPKDGAAKVKQTIKLFLAPETVVRAGARVAVTQCGRTTEYKAAGEPAVYGSHQEVVLELAGEYT